jgi:hypothetical protein
MASGGVARIRGGEVTRDEACVGFRGSEVTGAGQDQCGESDELEGRVLAVGVGIEAGERWRVAPGRSRSLR